MQREKMKEYLFLCVFLNLFKTFRNFYKNNKNYFKTLKFKKQNSKIFKFV